MHTCALTLIGEILIWGSTLNSPNRQIKNITQSFPPYSTYTQRGQSESLRFILNMITEPDESKPCHADTSTDHPFGIHQATCTLYIVCRSS